MIEPFSVLLSKPQDGGQGNNEVYKDDSNKKAEDTDSAEDSEADDGTGHEADVEDTTVETTIEQEKDQVLTTTTQSGRVSCIPRCYQNYDVQTDMMHVQAWDNYHE